MTALDFAALVDLLLDEPAPYVLTDRGERVAGSWVTTAEAACLLQMTLSSTAALAAEGLISARKVGNKWWLQRAGVETYRRERRGRMGPPRGVPRRPRPPMRHLDAAPLVALVEKRGGLRACGARPGSAEEAAFYRARRDGWVTERAADRLAVRLLGLTPVEVWGHR